MAMRQAWQGVLNAVRGVLIGVAEIVPGVSGGTIALIVGVYTALIEGAASVVKGLVGLVRGAGLGYARRSIQKARWSVLLPVLLGMVVGIFTGAAFLEPVIEQYPTETRAVFAGLILASLWVPIQMVGKHWGFRWFVLAILAAAASFALTGLPNLTAAGFSLWWVAPAAALAVCALVLPGVSGSFILVVLGVYEPTLAAVNDRNIGYLAVFIAGAIVGIAVFVRVLQWLLTHQRTLTLVVMTGLMVGSLRALWPWQGEGRQLLPPTPDGGLVWLLVGAGMLAVLIVVLVESVAKASVNAPDEK